MPIFLIPQDVPVICLVTMDLLTVPTILTTIPTIRTVCGPSQYLMDAMSVSSSVTSHWSMRVMDVATTSQKSVTVLPLTVEFLESSVDQQGRRESCPAATPCECISVLMAVTHTRASLHGFTQQDLVSNFIEKQNLKLLSNFNPPLYPGYSTHASCVFTGN